MSSLRVARCTKTDKVWLIDEIVLTPEEKAKRRLVAANRPFRLQPNHGRQKAMLERLKNAW